jgi:DNA-binding CsgD family transcriptional regulator
VSKAARLLPSDYRALYELTHECRDRGDDAVGWRQHFFARLATLTGADLVIGGELSGLKSGLPRDLGTTDWGWEHGFDRDGWLRALELLQSDPTYSPMLAEYGRRLVRQEGIALRRTEMADERVWQRSAECQEVFGMMGVDHAVYCLCSVPGTADDVSGAFLLRSIRRRDFSPREKAIIQEAHVLLAGLVGGALARFGEPSPSELPPRVRQILLCLLEGDGDKQIAVRLKLSVHTVNEYAKRVFVHFGVVSRTELLARWVRRGWGNGAPGWADAP